MQHYVIALKGAEWCMPQETLSRSFSACKVTRIYIRDNLRSSESSSATMEKGRLGISFCRLHATSACAPVELGL